MTNGNNPTATTTEPFHIGKMIENELRRQKRTVSWFSNQLPCDRRNVYNIFKRPYIDTGLLFSICKVSRTNLFNCYSEALSASISDQSVSKQVFNIDKNN